MGEKSFEVELALFKENISDVNMQNKENQHVDDIKYVQKWISPYSIFKQKVFEDFNHMQWVVSRKSLTKIFLNTEIKKEIIKVYILKEVNI